MRVNGINIENFKGIEKLSHRFSDTVTLIYGPVGSGKTSAIQGLTYGLTGELPSKPIRQNAEKAIVMLDCGDDLCIEREVLPPTKKVVKIVGRKVGVTASTKYIEEQMNVGNEIMKIVTSSDVFRNLKPTEFGNIFLNESEEKMKREEIYHILQKLDTKEKATLMKDEIDKTKLPEDVVKEIKKIFPKAINNLEDINKAYTDAKNLKKEKTALYKNAVTRSKGFLEIVKPEYKESDLQKKLEEIIGVQKNIEAYKASVEAYNNALKNKLEQEKQIAKLELLISTNEVKEPDQKSFELTKNEIKDCEKKIDEQKKVLYTLKDNVRRLNNTITQLGKPICPISEKLICNTDKTECKEDLEKAVHENEESITTVTDTINEFQNALSEKRAFVDAYLKEKERYEKTLIYKKQLSEVKANIILLPEKPDEAVSKTDYRAEKAELQKRLDFIRKYNDYEVEYLESLDLKRECDIFDFLTKALEPKGPVVTQFIETFAEFLEDSCNERAELLKTGFETKFVVEDGLKVLFKPKDGSSFLPFSNLSNGEKIFAELILTDLINSFCNSKILILDNLDNLDKKSFQKLLSFVTREDIKELYDNILISFVDHEDLIEVAKNYSVDQLKF
jgi:DNA repair exonuclease SbcCD ATPase subunit